MSLYLLGLALGVAAAAAAALAPARARPLVAGLSGAAACAVALAGASRVLATGRVATWGTGQLLPLAGVHLELDPLGALFVATASAVGLAASCYGVGYSAGALRSRSASALVPLFVTSLLLVPAAASVATFMAAWELMALTSTLLVLVEQRHRPSARDAAVWYAAMTQAGAAMILLGLLLVAPRGGGGATFAAIRAHAPALSAPSAGVAFVLVLVGFASKAGAVPFHVWLPRAHPEAPSPVSALMSGAMVNLGVYGVVRVGGLLGGGRLWWWLVVLVLGVLSALYGALHAAASSDIKRLLAFSTVDNVGLVLVGVGASGALRVTGHPALAALALVAALVHLVNHAGFKGLLFLGAGAVERSAGTRNLDELGGLARRMPVTAALFGTGALAIAAVPGLNGFTGEWLLFEALLHGFAARTAAVVVALLAGVAALALTGGLTVAAFVKVAGVGLLGRPRSGGAASAGEARPSMLAAMAVLAASCVVLGLAPGLLLPAVERAVAVALGTTSPVARRGAGIELAAVKGAVEPFQLLAGVLVALLLVRFAVHAVGRRGVRRAGAWGCGRELQTPRMQYTATSFAEPLGRVFEDVLQPSHDLEVTHVVESRYFPAHLSYRTEVADAIERTCYQPAIRAVRAWGRLARRMQNGSVHRYLAYGFVAVVVALVALS